MNSTVSTREDGLGFRLRDLASPLFRRKRALITTFFFAFAVAVLFGLLRLHKYESHMAIRVSRERLDPPGTAEAKKQIGTIPPLTDQEVKSAAESLKSRDLLEQVVLSSDLLKAHGFFLDVFRHRQTKTDPVARAVRALASQIEVEIPSRTNLIEVTYSSSDPVLAYSVLNRLGSLYMAKHAAVHRPPGSQAQNNEAALEDAEAGLRAFRPTQSVSDPNKQRTGLAAQLAVAAARSRTIEQAIATDEQRIQNGQETTRQDTQTDNLLLKKLDTTLMKRAQLLQRYQPSDPLVQQADQEIAKAKTAIAEAEKNPHVNQTTDRDPPFKLMRANLAKDEADLAGQRASLASNRRDIENMKSRMVTLGSQFLDEADLEREAKVDERNYLLYLSKREQERASNAVDRTRIESVAIVIPPAIPFLPSHGPAFILLIAFALAVLVSFLTAYIIDYFDPSFHTLSQVIDILGIPVVVAVPRRTA